MRRDGVAKEEGDMVAEPDTVAVRVKVGVEETEKENLAVRVAVRVCTGDFVIPAREAFVSGLEVGERMDVAEWVAVRQLTGV